MKKRGLYLLLCAGLAAVAALTALTMPATAEPRTITVRLITGEVVTITVDVPTGAELGELLPGEVVPPGTPSEPPPAPEPQPTAPAPAPSPAPAPGSGTEQRRGGDRTPAERPDRADRQGGTRTEIDPQAPVDPQEIAKQRQQVKETPLRRADGSPSPSNPGFVDALPGPAFGGGAFATGVPNFVIRKFRVPIFLLPIYQAAGIEYGVRWEVLAAINEIETDYGRNLNVSSAGALGWMQFIPSSWQAYGVDANKDGKKDPYNPVDAIFAAARYLKAADYENDVRGAIFAYNHADWYVDSVLMRARLIAGVPADLVGSLTGLTEGRFPVAARARYADDLQEQEQVKRVAAGQNAANVIETDDGRTAIEIYAEKGAPVVATNDGQIKKIGQNKKLGRYITLQDVYGNRYTYTGLGSVARLYPATRGDLSVS
ncbi:MAG: lytic murein transglycosylase [Thermoleophilaceae bacterium]